MLYTSDQSKISVKCDTQSNPVIPLGYLHTFTITKLQNVGDRSYPHSKLEKLALVLEHRELLSVLELPGPDLFVLIPKSYGF